MEFTDNKVTVFENIINEKVNDIDSFVLIEPYKYYDLGIRKENFSLNFITPSNDYLKEYAFEFKVPQKVPTISLPFISFINTELNITKNKLYQFMVIYDGGLNRKPIVMFVSTNLPIFTLNKNNGTLIDQFAFQPDQTWQEFVNSKYNNGSFNIRGQEIHYGSSGALNPIQGQTPSNVITENTTYICGLT